MLKFAATSTVGFRRLNGLNFKQISCFYAGDRDYRSLFCFSCRDETSSKNHRKLLESPSGINQTGEQVAKIDDAIVIGADRIADKLDFLPLITILVP
jgi:hypothetical protein